jgi:inner membrane protein YidH
VRDDETALMRERSQAREHLANERTALAWTRTSVTLISVGFAVSRYGLFLSRTGDATHGGNAGVARVLGGLLVAAGVAVAGAACARFLRARVQIRNGAFRPEAWLESALTGVTVALGVGLVAYILASP